MLHTWHVQSCDDVPVQIATEWTASVHTSHMPKPVMTKCHGNGLLPYILHTWHVQSCDDVPVQIATEWTASVHTLYMSKPVMTFRFTMLRNGHFDAYFTHAQTCDDKVLRKWTAWLHTIHTWHVQSCDDVPVQSATALDCFGTYSLHVQACDDIQVHSATEWTVSTPIISHMPKPVMTKCYGNGLLPYILHFQTCDGVCVRSATEWTASVILLHTFPNLCRRLSTFKLKLLRNGPLRYVLHTCPNNL